MTPVVSLPWQLSWLQSLSVKNQMSPFPTLLGATEGLAWNRHACHKLLTLQKRLLGVDGTCLRQRLIKTGPATKLLSWQQCHRCHFVSFVMYISGAKFEEHCFNIYRDILDSVFYHFSCTVYYVITFLICIIQKH